VFIKYAWHWLGIPYGWGGQTWNQADCSGLIHELLQAVGIEKRGFDCTAHNLYVNFKANNQIIEINDRQAGDLIFWFNNGKATHVGILIKRDFVINAGGGGSKIKTIEDAIKHNAFVRIDPIEYNGDSYKICDPFKDEQ